MNTYLNEWNFMFHADITSENQYTSEKSIPGSTTSHLPAVQDKKHRSSN